MTSKINVFVSFARNGEDFLALLFERLEAQPDLTVWNYAQEGQEIPVGEPLIRFLRERIEQSQVFIPVITHAYLHSSIALEEARIALEHATHHPLKIASLFGDSISLHSQHSLPAPIGDLMAYRHASADFTSISSMDEVVRTLCEGSLGMGYHPVIREEPRLPIIGKVFAEICGEFLRNERPRELATRDHANYGRLMRILERFHEHYAKKEEARATHALTLADELFQFEYGSDRRLYFPAVMKAVLLAKQGSFTEAHALLDTTQAWAEKEKKLDGNLFSARGLLYFEEGQYGEAAHAYAEAVRRTSDESSDRYNEIICRLRDGQIVDLPRAFQAIENAPMLEGDATKIALSKAVAYREAWRLSQRNQKEDSTLWRQSDVLFSELRKQQQLTAEGYSEYAYLVQDSPERLYELMVEATGRYQGDQTSHLWLAKLFTASPYPAQGMEQYRLLAVSRPYRHRCHVEAMRGFFRAGAKTQAKALATELIDLRIFPAPATPWEYFCTGAANWVLEKVERANQDHERSGYRQSYPELFGQS